MVKRKQKTSESSASKISKTTNGFGETIPNDERKGKLILFDFEENECDLIIMANDREVHLPSCFLKMASDDDLQIVDGRINIDVSAESVMTGLSFYVPKIWNSQNESKFVFRPFYFIYLGVVLILFHNFQALKVKAFHINICLKIFGVVIKVFGVPDFVENSKQILIFLVENLEETLHVAETLNLCAFKNHIVEDYIEDSCKSNLINDNQIQIQILNLAHKYGFLYE